MQAYRGLGFGPSRIDSAAAREAVLAQGDPFLSIYDSACAHVDDGTLRMLAARLSGSWKTCAVVTTVQDNTDFEFLLYHRSALRTAIRAASPRCAGCSRRRPGGRRWE
jgi:hypothetical protein